MPKMMLHDDDARRALGRGVAQLARAVRGTLGPRGMNAIIDRPVGTPMISRDGVSIASGVELEDPFENMGAQVAREVSMKTNEVVGDGTTTGPCSPTRWCSRASRRSRPALIPWSWCTASNLPSNTPSARCARPHGRSRQRRAALGGGDRRERQGDRRTGRRGARAGRAKRPRHGRVRRDRGDVRNRRRDGVRPRLSVAPHGDRHRADAGGAGRALHPDDRPQAADARDVAAIRAVPRTTPAAAGHR